MAPWFKRAADLEARMQTLTEAPHISNIFPVTMALRFITAP